MTKSLEGYYTTEEYDLVQNINQKMIGLFSDWTCFIGKIEWEGKDVRLTVTVKHRINHLIYFHKTILITKEALYDRDFHSTISRHIQKDVERLFTMILAPKGIKYDR